MARGTKCHTHINTAGQGCSYLYLIVEGKGLEKLLKLARSIQEAKAGLGPGPNLYELELVFLISC
jgi:hypothetical protein